MNKTPKQPLSAEEIELFRTTCKDIKPLVNKNLHFSLKTTPKINSSRTIKKDFFYEDTEIDCTAEEELYFARGGLSHKTLTQLRRGPIKIEARLDLHRFIGVEAIATTQNFLENAQERAYRWVLIIHGKGHFSKEGKAVLKSLLNKWLRQQPAVLAFASSQARHGGTGALYVLLKKRGAHA